MPAFYAHKFFGAQVLQSLPAPLQAQLRSHEAAFILGTQGPDILFYHKPFTKNEIKDKGTYMHLCSAKSFFISCAEKIRQTQAGAESAEAAYVAGFICHFMLDNACHPHIYQLEDTGVSHGLIESEFDKYLKKQNGKRVHKNAAKRLTKRQGVAPAVSNILDVEEKAIKRSIRTMRTVNGLFSSPLRSFHALARVVLKKLHAEKFESMFLHFKNDAACDALNPTLQTQLQNAIMPTAKLLQTYFQAIETADNGEHYTIFDKDYKGESLS